MEPQTQNRRDKRRQRTRDALIAAAAETYVLKGVANTMVADITEAADVGYGTFYKYFDSLNDVVSAVAEAAMKRVIEVARTYFTQQEPPGLGPAVSVRLIMRLMSADPAIRQLLERPHVFVDEWNRTVSPVVRSFIEEEEVTRGDVFEAVGGTSVWLMLQPWIVMCLLNDAIEKGSTAQQEEALAKIALLMGGMDEKSRMEVIEASRNVVDTGLGTLSRPLPR